MNKIINGVVYLDLNFYSPEVLSKIKKKLDENKIPNSYCVGGVVHTKLCFTNGSSIKSCGSLSDKMRSYTNKYLIFDLDKIMSAKFNHNLKTYN